MVAQALTEDLKVHYLGLLSDVGYLFPIYGFKKMKDTVNISFSCFLPNFDSIKSSSVSTLDNLYVVATNRCLADASWRLIFLDDSWIFSLNSIYRRGYSDAVFFKVDPSSPPRLQFRFG